MKQNLYDTTSQTIVNRAVHSKEQREKRLINEEGEVIMSNSKSDVVTHSVCSSIRNQGVARKFKGCLKYKECFKKVSRKF